MNKYSVLSDDETGVTLKILPNELGSDYINASFIKVSVPSLMIIEIPKSEISYRMKTEKVLRFKENVLT
jgi:protein tyrosine phosphatase